MPDEAISVVGNYDLKIHDIASHILIETEKVTGHRYVTIIADNGARTTMFVHRLVAIAFIPNNDPLKNVANHKDGNPRNNHVSNLE